jgi:mannose-6-phosphate isomerase-like protein (cupin superfamily)
MSILPASLDVPRDGGERFDLGGVGFHWKIDGPHTEGRFAVVHNRIAPRTLVAPLHRHRREDEFTFVLAGTMGTLRGDEVVLADQGTWVFKPRNQWHTLWNSGDAPCEIIEVISPAGFENYFREIATIGHNLLKLVEINQKYELEMDLLSVPTLCARFGLTFLQSG